MELIFIMHPTNHPDIQILINKLLTLNNRKIGNIWQKHGNLPKFKADNMFD